MCVRAIISLVRTVVLRGNIVAGYARAVTPYTGLTHVSDKLHTVL